MVDLYLALQLPLLTLPLLLSLLAANRHRPYRLRKLLRQHRRLPREKLEKLKLKLLNVPTPQLRKPQLLAEAGRPQGNKDDKISATRDQQVRLKPNKSLVLQIRQEFLYIAIHQTNFITSLPYYLLFLSSFHFP